jgi:long-chain fatty acid transport protein
MNRTWVQCDRAERGGELKKMTACRISHSLKPMLEQPVSRKVVGIIALIIFFGAFVSSARAAGLLLYETGAPDLGTASAGRTAMAADASTAAANPAGMTQLDRTQLMVTSGALLPSTNFDVAPETTTSGGGGGNAGVFFPIGGSFYVYRLTDRLRLGLATDSNFGLTENYGKTWVGRYYLTYESIISGTINPSLAYEVNDWLSVGAGVSFSVARLKFQSKINNALPRVPDGGLAFESWDEAFGGNVGVLLKPIEKLRIGLTYQSPVDYKFGFRPHLTGLGPLLGHIRKRIGGVKINLPMEVPQQVMMSAIYDLTPNLSLMGNVGWQNWSAFGEFPIGISSTKQRTVAANLHFSDTCQVAIGEQLRFGERWLWSAGFAYDSSTVSKANRVPALPIDRQLRYGTGIQYQVNNDITAGLAGELLDAGPAPYSARRGPLAGTLQGHYSSNYLNFLGVNLTWKFGSGT